MNALSPVSPLPAHVPAEAVYDFDMYLDPQLLTDPHERVREMLRDAPPVFWTPRNGGHWVIIGHKENYEASRDTEVFSSELFPSEMIPAILAAMPGATHLPLPTPINMDPPDHTRFRAPLNAAFSPKAMMARKEEVRALANELIDKVIEQGHCDFIPDIAEPLPVQVFLKLMGLPVERMVEFRDLVHEFMSPPTGPLDGFLRMRKVADAMRGEIEAWREEPRDDLISLLWRTE
ncbi:MAG TPA: cytochrome P450, partial [Sphingobium sp.]